MAINKRPYELSVWVEQLNKSNSKIEKKGIIIGAHDMSYLGKATNIVLKRELKGTNTLTFDMPDKYFDSLSGEYVRNEFIDMLYNEAKLKLFYNNRWYEFFIKKVDEKKQFKSYMKSFTCTDAFIDELSRNGYGITYDTDLYNNVEEIGTFSERTLEDSIWQYYPQNNWGDFTEYKEEKLYRIPISCFGGSISGYKLNFELDKQQSDKIAEKYDTNLIVNLFTEDVRPAELSDDIARGCFWDEYSENNGIVNPLEKEFYTDIPNDGYIYVPYSCLSFCYGSQEEPDFTEQLSYDRAATETAISLDDKLLIAPQSVDPRTLIQFYAIPKTGVLELDDAGVIMNKEYTFFMPLAAWNRSVKLDEDWWYIFEDTRLVHGQILGSADVQQPCISHTFKYLKNGQDEILNTDFESRGNKCVTYDGYLSDVNGNYIVKGKKFSITDRTEVNISEEINQYTTIYNVNADNFIKEYSNEDWDYSEEKLTSSGEHYRVCSKTDTRQIVPQLARNLVQNGIEMDSVDGWAPMSYLIENSILTTPAVTQRGVITAAGTEDISSSCLVFSPTVAQVAYIWNISRNNTDNSSTATVKFIVDGKTWYSTSLYDSKNRDTKFYYSYLSIFNRKEGKNVYAIGTKLYTKETETIDGVKVNRYIYLCDKNDNFYKGLVRKDISTGKTPFTITQTNSVEIISPNSNNEITYFVDEGAWDSKIVEVDSSKGYWGRTNTKTTTPKTATVSSGTQLINFGIIGQSKIIEKEKIYCLGVQALAKDKATANTFKIKIGKGSLVSEGNYRLLDNTVLTLSANDGIAPTDWSGKWIDSGVDQDGDNIVISTMPETKFLLFKTNYNIENPYFTIECDGKVILLKLYLFEAYTKGVDCFATTEAEYRYSGRDIFWPPKDITKITSLYRDGIEIAQRTDVWTEDVLRKHIIFEDDIMLGSTYGYQKYYIQRLKANMVENNQITHLYCDTMGKSSFLSSEPKEIKENMLPLDAAKLTSDDYTIETNYIDLTKCKYYDQNAALDECDCSYGNGHTCFYQKFGYCPFRFTTEKHNRRIRTLSINKSNRFNIIQTISKVFEIYPQFYIEHKLNGSVIKNDEGEYIKKVFYITEKGKENKIGFRYEKNLKDISRNVASDQIVTKLYVLDVDSELSKTGLCSIKSAEDNPSKDSYIIDMSYYVQKGMLDADEVEQDLYGVTPTANVLKEDDIPSGFLKQLGYYNNQYDELSNKIINLQDASYTELEANLNVNYQAIITAQEQILKIKKQLDKYKETYGDSTELDNQKTYKNYLTKLSEQQSILSKLIDSTFYTNGKCDNDSSVWEGDCFEGNVASTSTPVDFFNHIIDLDGSKKYWIDQHKYKKGILGQYNSEFLQIQQWKKERASYLKLINQISSAFYRKYEPYLKEGTWSDSNYLTDNAYYFGALDVAAEGAIPKVSYSISVIDLAPISEEYEDIYDFDLADTTYVEDIGMFGIDKHTGLPNKLKVLISSVSENIDDPSKNSISVQNYTTSFQDLFQQVTASVQSLTYNENIYKRSSNFTSLQNITTSSLQGTLDTNDLTLINTDENNIQVDNTGTSGSDINNHANKYKLDGQGLFFSNDGGQHWSVGVGPSGINADYIKVGNLDAGKIRIADSSYVYFSWDKDGIAAYRDPQSINTDSTNINDAAIFNKYGLSIIEDGKIKLRAGYGFNGTNGDTSTEQELSDNIGFYLYNSEGNVIFSTQSAKSSDAKRDTASLKLVGEMLVTNSSQSEYITNYSYVNEYVFNTINYVVRNSTIDDRDSSKIVYDTTNEYYPVPQQYSSEVEVAAVLFASNEELATVVVGYSPSTKKTYTKTNVREVSSTYYIGEQSKLDNIFYSYIETNFSTETEEYSIAITNISSNKYYIIKDKKFDTGIMLNGIDTDSHTESSYQNASIVSYYKDNNGVLTKTDSALYKIGNKYYSDRLGNSGGMSDSSVALYLNNPSLSDNIYGQDKSFVQRLFVCCKQYGASVKNLFTVLKDGTAYFGGDIYDSSSNQAYAVELKDNIKIANAGIKIDAKGQLYISFDSIRDINNDKLNLTSYIANQIDQELTSASGPIYDAIAGVIVQINNSNAGLQQQINEIANRVYNQTLIAHGHKIKWKDVEFTPPGAPSQIKSAKDVKVWMQPDQSVDAYWVLLSDLIEDDTEITGG